MRQYNIIKANVLTIILALISSLVLSAEDTIKIALAGPVTGPFAQYGDMQFIGAKMAIKHINQKGGVNGKKMEAVIFDDSCNPKKASEVAHKIVDKKIRFVVGHLCSSATIQAVKIYEAEGVLMITPASTSPEITTQGYKLVFRTIGLDIMQADPAADYIINQIKPRKMAIIHDGRPYGKGLAAHINHSVRKAGIEIALSESITSGKKDFTHLITKLKQQDIDFVYYGGYHPELGLILKQSAAQGLKIKYMGPEVVGNMDLTAIAGKAAEGLLVTLPKSFDSDPENKKLIETFKTYGQDPSGSFVLPAYSAIQVMADGMKLSSSENPEKVALSLRAHRFQTPTGQLTFDHKGDLKNFTFIVYQWHADGTKTPLTQ